jgi:hypothetical protein
MLTETEIDTKTSYLLFEKTVRKHVRKRPKWTSAEDFLPQLSSRTNFMVPNFEGFNATFSDAEICGATCVETTQILNLLVRRLY